jgi:hypothetical protein
MDKQLAGVFGFTETDLVANRQGHLNEKQLSEFRADTKETLAVYRVVLLLLPLPILINYFNFNIVFLGFAFALMEAAAILIYQHLRKQARFSLKAGDLKTVEGIVRFKLLERLGRSSHYVYVGDERFLVNKAQFYLLSEQAFYRFYFTGNRVWSCETLSSP